MFITIQFPFVDLRPFLQNPPMFVPRRLPFNVIPRRNDLENLVNKNIFVRHFGKYKLRGYVPVFNKKKEHPPVWVLKDEEQWNTLENLWQDEYLFASTKRGLRFQDIEKKGLLNGKLVTPRVKIRALRFSPFSPFSPLWSPCMRIEIGVLYSVVDPLDGTQLINALIEFLKLKVNVSSYMIDGAGKNAVVTKKRNVTNLLIDQKKALAELVVYGTTSQTTAKKHPQMVVPGEPLLTVHYFPGELSSLPNNSITLPRNGTEEFKIDYCLLRKHNIRVWLFENPDPLSEPSRMAQKRDAIRNHTIAIMRYWSELQAMLGLRREIIAQSFNFNVKNNDQLENFINKKTNFLMSGYIHGTNLNIIRNVMNSFQFAIPEKLEDTHNAFKDFRRQIREKLTNFSTNDIDIFVSYSHKDLEYLPIVQKALSPFLNSMKIKYFDDTNIKPGDEWETQILHYLENAKCVILLVSNNFKKSKYINYMELPRIIDNYKRGKIIIIPILIKGSIPKEGILNSIQFLNKNESLSKMKKHQIDPQIFNDNFYQMIENLSTEIISPIIDNHTIKTQNFI